ncbi:unnamed protein product, partial [Ectocarpus fasciculatus]
IREGAVRGRRSSEQPSTMAHEGLWPREYNRTGEAGVRTLAAADDDGVHVLPRKSGRGGEAPAAGGGGNGSYHLGLLLETPMDNDDTQQQGRRRREHCSSSSAFDFVCSSSGTTAQEGVGFDRVCALRGEVVHIFTFFHPDGGADEDGSSSSGEAGATAAGTSSVSLELE